jgi:hypothetical protein
MEVICSSQMSVEFQQTTWCYIPEYSTVRNYHCENIEFFLDMEATLREVCYNVCNG